MAARAGVVTRSPLGSPDIRRSVLPGGLRVVTEQLPGARSASVGIWIGVGSRDERHSVAGVAHFLEHLLFKSTPTRTALDIAQLMDSIGGELNAFTTQEHTCFYAHVIDEDLALAVDLVSDVVLRGQCHSADVDIERHVVLEEISMREDDPDDLLGDAFFLALFGDHPIGRPITGTVDSVERMSRRQLQSFHVRRYTPDRMVVAVTGNIEHEHTVELVRRAFHGHVDQSDLPAPRREGTIRLPAAPALSLTTHDSEQVHLALGVRAFGRHDDHHHWPISVLNMAVGGGLSSRLFQRIREERGLAYAVHSSAESFADTGVFAVFAACHPENLAEVTTLIREVLAEVAAAGITSDECARAKGALHKGLVLGLEDAGSRMNRIGSSELDYGYHRSVAETLARIDAVTPEQIGDMASDLLGRHFAAAVVGPYKRERDLPAAVRGIVG